MEKLKIIIQLKTKILVAHFYSTYKIEKKNKQNAIEECQENHDYDYFQDDAELKYANLKPLFNHSVIV